MTPVDLFWSHCEGPLVHGANDCCITVADVIVAAGGPDLMGPYRGRYRTRIGFVRAFHKAGYRTLAEGIAATFADHGRQVDEPHDFDVTVIAYIDAAGERVSSPAFYHSGFWCLRSERGGVCAKADPETIWRVIDA